MRERPDPSEPAFVRPGSAAASERNRPDRGARAGPGLTLARLGLALFLGYFGALAFGPGGARAIQPLVDNSPTLAWLGGLVGNVDAARVLGGVQILAALLLVAGAFSTKLGLLGSLLAVAVFTATLSFLVTTPGTFTTTAGFPLPAPSPAAAFITKDVFLLGLALWSVLAATRALRRRG